MEKKTFWNLRNCIKNIFKIDTNQVKKKTFWKSTNKKKTLRICTCCVCITAEILTPALAESYVIYSQPVVCVTWLVLLNVSVCMCARVCKRERACVSARKGVELPYEDLQRLVQASHFLILTPHPTRAPSASISNIRPFPAGLLLL